MKLFHLTLIVIVLLLLAQTASAAEVNSTLWIESQPSAAGIYINGTHSGFTPASVEIPSGFYTILIAKEGYEEYTVDLKVCGNETLPITAALTSLENGTSTPEPTEETTPQPTATATEKTPVVTAVETRPATSAETGKFRVGPVVKVRPVSDIVTKGNPGLVEFYYSNPSINDVALTAEIYVSVPAGVHVSGEGFGVGGAAGSIHGLYTVPPGSDRTIYMDVIGEKVGEFTVHAETIYYPGANKDLFQQISLTHPFNVKEPRAQRETATQSLNWDEAESTATPTVPGFTAVATLCVLGALILIGGCRKKL